MDFGNTNRPAVVGIQILPARSDVAAMRGSVPVELPPERTVQSATAGNPVQIDVRQSPSRSGTADERETAQRRSAEPPPERDPTQAGTAQEKMRDVIERRLMIDPDTRSVVMQKRNRSTGETVVTVPDEMSLKLRQYSRELMEQARQEAETPRYVERIA